MIGQCQAPEKTSLRAMKTSIGMSCFSWALDNETGKLDRVKNSIQGQKSFY
jgi:hypothetical protein